ncbi:unnamed protein product [Allacma fusca]|uniref:SMB domain-containing protein n=1 Tax=Allacma fusca TaxID=39272 RepID=A0A8J2P051_9HEXA|nr:unnamed protein product [Allacma fusca]
MRGRMSPTIPSAPTTVPPVKSVKMKVAEFRKCVKFTQSSAMIFLFVIISLEQLCFISGTAEPGVRQAGRASLVRPIRVTYGDLEKANKTCPSKDTCAPSRNDRNGAMMNDYKRRNCFCDQQCIVYEDCCVDSPYRRDPNVTYKKNDIFQCVQLRQFGSLYMKTRCPATWQDEMEP